MKSVNGGSDRHEFQLLFFLFLFDYIHFIIMSCKRQKRQRRQKSRFPPRRHKPTSCAVQWIDWCICGLFTSPFLLSTCIKLTEDWRDKFIVTSRHRIISRIWRTNKSGYYIIIEPKSIQSFIHALIITFCTLRASAACRPYRQWRFSIYMQIKQLSYGRPSG